MGKGGPSSSRGVLRGVQQRTCRCQALRGANLSGEPQPPDKITSHAQNFGDQRPPREHRHPGEEVQQEGWSAGFWLEWVPLVLISYSFLTALERNPSMFAFAAHTRLFSPGGARPRTDAPNLTLNPRFRLRQPWRVKTCYFKRNVSRLKEFRGTKKQYSAQH